MVAAFLVRPFWSTAFLVYGLSGFRPFWYPIRENSVYLFEICQCCQLNKTFHLNNNTYLIRQSRHPTKPHKQRSRIFYRQFCVLVIKIIISLRPLGEGGGGTRSPMDLLVSRDWTPTVIPKTL